MKRLLSKSERKRTFDIIKLIKTTYEGNIFISNLSGNMSIVASKAISPLNKIFETSYYTGVVERLIPELAQSLVSIDVLYNAFKAKAESVDVCDNNHIYLYSESGEEFFVGERLSLHEHNLNYAEAIHQFDDIFNVLDAYESIDNMNNYGWYYDTKMCTSEEIVRLVNYETITVRSDNESDVGLILTAKCFPNIKKCEGIQLDWLYHEGEEMYSVLVTSQFMSAAVFKPIVFHMMVKALRC